MAQGEIHKRAQKGYKCFMMPLLQVSTTSLCTYANFPNPTEPFKSDHICLPHCFSPTTSPYNLNLPLLYPHFFNFFLLYYFITGSYHYVKSNVRAEDFLHSAENSCLIGGKKRTLNTQHGEGNGTPLQYSCLENPMDGGAWKAAVHRVTEGRARLRDFTFTFHFHALEKEMATHSSVLAWRIPETGEPGGLPSMGSHRVGHD